MDTGRSGRRFAGVVVGGLLGAMVACLGGLAGCSSEKDAGSGGMASEAAGRGERGANPGELTMMAWNIRFGTANDGPNSWPLRADRVVDVMIGPGGTPEAPAWDLVSVQEALRFQIDQVLAAAPGYAYAGYGRDDGVNAGEHCGVLYRPDRLELTETGRFWLSDTPDVVASTSWGNTITRMVSYQRFVDRLDEERDGFWVFSVHLDHQSEASRRESAELIAFRIETIAGTEPVIVLGDFNAPPESAERRYLVGEIRDATGDGIAPPSPRLVDAVLVAGEGPLGTFNGFRGGLTTGRFIDTVLVPPSTRIIEAWVDREMGVSEDGRPPSDHHPVIVRLGLK